MNQWRLIESQPSDISSQMALDRGLFEAFLQDPDALPLLRVYRVNEPGRTVGRSHKAEGGACVRPTGGGLVEHGNDLIYSVMARRDTFPTFHQVRTSYLSFHEAIQEALGKLGIETSLMRCDDPRIRRGPTERNGFTPRGGPEPYSSGRGTLSSSGTEDSSGLAVSGSLRGATGRSSGHEGIGPCFTHPVATDLMYQEKKIAGGAQWRRGRAFLHQGSVLPPRVPYESLKQALIDAFRQKFGIVWQTTASCNESIDGRPLSAL